MELFTKFLKLLHLYDCKDVLYYTFEYGTIKFGVMEDLVHPSYQEVELVESEDDLQLLMDCFASTLELDSSIDGALLYICKKRNYVPQGRIFDTISPQFKHLFTDIANAS